MAIPMNAIAASFLKACLFFMSVSLVVVMVLQA
jgi:hypothetical protein